MCIIKIIMTSKTHDFFSYIFIRFHTWQGIEISAVSVEKLNNLTSFIKIPQLKTVNYISVMY